jgi:hypothetical protein
MPQVSLPSLDRVHGKCVDCACVQECNKEQDCNDPHGCKYWNEMYTAVLDTGEMVSRPVEKNKAVAWELAK